MSEEKTLTEIIQDTVAENSTENTQSAETEVNSNEIEDADSFLESIVADADLDDDDA